MTSTPGRYEMLGPLLPRPKFQLIPSFLMIPDTLFCRGVGPFR